MRYILVAMLAVGLWGCGDGAPELYESCELETGCGDGGGGCVEPDNASCVCAQFQTSEPFCSESCESNADCPGGLCIELPFQSGESYCISREDFDNADDDGAQEPAEPDEPDQCTIDSPKAGELEVSEFYEDCQPQTCQDAPSWAETSGTCEGGYCLQIQGVRGMCSRRCSIASNDCPEEFTVCVEMDDGEAYCLDRATMNALSDHIYGDTP